ncbi:hypothetical protein TCAL_10625 [Tigriopus californicus]|uniref:G-protein coupled receptors family 2 profile 2 domain-containing protein n=1 Tax=Tigriopus californicus TaxID=6832 RepID=A0A553PGX1_TIGCA|nr:adhesion G-protein coupled receptor G6-like [Tigriopus californicus]TRY76932.1 hypothetical protein TCAL_10625 [Tigriopus californicus]|eukprot:TCALIF_10625-PA protein Name:"Similar to GPR133 Probable G-protein coupled receptor 133 (Bos taurus)" AED:0.00 eAED:0.00 QI:176/1/0.75/1/0.66/0.5/4/185/481
MKRYSLMFRVLVAFTSLFAVLGQQRPINIDGQWSPWSTITTPCMRANVQGQMMPVTCGGGTQRRIRSCTNPRPQGLRPKPCVGTAEEQIPCNVQPCNMQWSPWSGCSAKCGRGNRRRYTLCAAEAEGNLTDCKALGLKNQAFEHIEECNTWVNDRAVCPSPCEGYNCMEFANCVDISDNDDPKVDCVCQLGRIMNDKDDACIVPPPTTPTPRPNPTLPAAVKTATTAVTRTASTLLIIFTGITLFLFASLRIYDDGRVIQMNMEIALILAHIMLLIPPLHDYPDICKVISILLHFFFTACFMFMFLESLHTYSLVAFVVKKSGLFSRGQNFFIGWGVALGVILLSLGFHVGDYGGEYHCWLRMNTGLMMTQIIPIVILVILTFTMIEAAGAAEYRRLPGMDQQQLVSAKIMQRTNLIIMPLVFVSYIVGVIAEYEQNVAMYGTFTIINGVLGGCIFFFHSTGNEQVREKLTKGYNLIFKKE